MEVKAAGAVSVALLAVTLCVLPVPVAVADTERARITWDNYGDIDLHVFDDEGNHAGFDDDEFVIENGIPDATLSTTGYEVFTDRRVPSSRTFMYCAEYYDPGDWYEGEELPPPATATLTMTDPDGRQRTTSATVAVGETVLLGTSPETGATECTGTTAQPSDRDADGVADTADNCPDTPNPGQADENGDGTGDACAPRGAEPRFGSRTLVGLSLPTRKIGLHDPIKTRIRNRNAFEVTVTLVARNSDRDTVSRQVFDVAPKSRTTVKLSLPKTSRTVLADEGTLALRLIAFLRDPAGNGRKISKRVALLLED